MIGQTLGNYKIVAKLGNGAMGDVFLADHQRISRRAAIKILNQDLTTNPQLVARFFDEARATSLIRHPGIVEVFDCDVDPQGRVYLVMEYLEGQTLAARLEPDCRLPWPVACALARQVANALGAAHEKGIIHRDIKPENVFLTAGPASAGGATVKILDFGIAKLLDKDRGAAFRTVPGLLLGTPHYMPPEQCDGADSLDPRADIYALGCVLFRMISGRLPFAGSHVEDVIAAQTFRPAPPIGVVDPPTPGWLEALVARMLAKQPADRPSTMRTVAREMDRASTGRHVAGVLMHAGSSVVSRFAGMVGLSGSVRDRRRLAGMVAGFCAVMIGGGLWEVRAILRHEKPPARSIPSAMEPRPQSRPRSDAARIAQAPAPPAAPRTQAPPPAPAAPETAAGRVGDDAPVGAPSVPPPSVVRRPPAKARAAVREPVNRRPSQARVEMDGLVDL